MRTIKLVEWVLPEAPGQPSVKQDLTSIIWLILNSSVDKMPRGISSMHLLNRITLALDVARKEKVLKLEEAEYEFLKNFVEANIPSNLGASKDIVSAITDFMNAKQDK